jgi:hypothetical protein
MSPHVRQHVVSREIETALVQYHLLKDKVVKGPRGKELKRDPPHRIPIGDLILVHESDSIGECNPLDDPLLHGVVVWRPGLDLRSQ